MNVLKEYMIPDLSNIVIQYLLPDKAIMKKKYNNVIHELKVFYLDNRYFRNRCGNMFCEFSNKSTIVYRLSGYDYYYCRNKFIEKYGLKLLPKALYNETNKLCLNCANSIPFKHSRQLCGHPAYKSIC